MSERSPVEARPITATEVAAFFPEGKRPTVRGLAFFIGGNLSGIGGIVKEGNVWVAFSDIKKGVSVPDITVWRMAKLVMNGVVKQMPGAVYCNVSKDNPHGRKWAKMLGFKLYGETETIEVYRWN